VRACVTYRVELAIHIENRDPMALDFDCDRLTGRNILG
jgi:hypothetical protein